MTEKALITTDFNTIQRIALALHKSNYFSDVKSEAQAIVKVMAGAELGLPPFASMTGIHIIKGKPVLGANVIATLVKNDPRYNYKVAAADDTECFLEWYEDGNPAGVSSFTIKEATAAGLVGKDNWKKYPSDMLFARAISRGAKRYAPGIFGGSPVYTADEMGVEVDPDGYIVEGETVTTVSAERMQEITKPLMSEDVVDISDGPTWTDNGQDEADEPEPTPKPANDHDHDWTAYINAVKDLPHFEGQVKHVVAAANLLGITTANIGDAFDGKVQQTTDYANLRAAGMAQDKALEKVKEAA